MRLYIMRHGETDWNKEKRLQGRSDIPLNDFGRKLAYKTREGLKDVRFDLVITSPLARAKETAEIVKGKRDIPVLEDVRIEEMSFGSYEGMCCKGEGAEIPAEEFKKFFTDPAHYKTPDDGESFAEFCGRVEAFLVELFQCEAYEDRTILISVHGAVLCAILRAVKQNPLQMFWSGGVHKNCGVTIMDVRNGVPEIIRENVIYYDDEVEEW